MRFIISILFSILFSSQVLGQIRLDGFTFSTGIKFEIGFNAKGGSYLSISLAGGIKKNFYANEQIENLNKFQEVIKTNTFTGYQASINVYYNSIGDNILDEFKRVNIDFTNSLMATIGQSSDTSSFTALNLFVKPFNSQTPSVIRDNFFHSLTFGTNYVLNNTNRNQRIGFGNLNIARVVHLHYYNDGPPYGGWLGDDYDRYWTGGGALEIYLSQFLEEDLNFYRNSKISLEYDRFTSNIQDQFNVSNVLGFHYIPSKADANSMVNRSKFKVGVLFFEDHYEISAVKLGNLANDVQNWIHLIKHIPLHYTYSKGTWIFGLNYNNILTSQ